MTEETETLAGRMFGKWSEPGVPHAGWICEGVEDLGSYGAMTCEMCERQQIRYAHNMRHPQYPTPLICGCVCAGRMEGNAVRAKERERDFIKQNRRLLSWMRRGWKTSARGNLYKTSEGYRVVLQERPGGWGGLIFRGERRVGCTAQLSPTADDVKRRAFARVSSLTGKR